jgi:tetratricopeptide (TPR) repeat protein
MKLQDFTLIIFLLLLGSNIFGQKDNSFDELKEAAALFTAKEYLQAGQKYSQALEQIDLERPTRLRYQAGLAWALAGDKEQAFKYLYQLVENNYYTNFKELSLELGFKSLHKDKRWEEIKVLIKGNINEIEALLPFYEGMRGEDFSLDGLEKVHLPLDGETACMIPFRESERYGFVSNDKKQKWLIKPIYRQVLAVTEEGAIVLDTFGGYSVVKPDGTALIPASWHWISKEGNLYHTTAMGDCSSSPSGIPIKRFGADAIYGDCAKNDYYDTKGTLLFTEQAHDCQTFIGDDQLAWFRYGKRYRIRNKSGELVKEFEYENHQNTFVGISDDLLIYSVTNVQDSTTHYVAKDLDGTIKFKLPTTYNNPKSFQGIHGDRGVYQLSEQLYGIRRKLDYGTPYIFCDASGRKLEMKGRIRTLSTLTMDVDYFSQEQFIVYRSDPWISREKSMMVVNREGDTIIPKPTLMGDTTILIQYGNITRNKNGNYFCQLEGIGGRDEFDKNGELIERKPIMELKDKIIPWSQEKLDVLEEEYNKRSGYGLGYHPVEAFYDQFKFYSLNVPENPTEDLIPIARSLIMPTDTTEKGKVRYTSVGVHISYINSKGEKVLELPSDITFSGYFSEGLAPAMNRDNKLGFINLKGEWAILPKYEIIFVGDYPISLPDYPIFKGGYAYLRGYKGYVDKNGKEFFVGKRMKDHYNYSH